MEVTQEAERPALEPFLCGNPDVHVYAIGDLDPSCWDDCTWHGLREGGEGGELRAVALTYRGLATPVVQVLAEPGEPGAVAAAEELLRRLVAAPERLPTGGWEAHLNAGFEGIVAAGGFALRAVPHLRMAMGPAELERLAAEAVPSPPSGASAPTRLTPSDAAACMELCGTLDRSWFEPQCLEAGVYIGVWSSDAEEPQLLAMGGTHVAAPAYSVAALGNIATRAAARRQGHGAATTRALCLALREQGITTIGLNVTADNAAAISMYERLGFRTVMEFVECDVEPKGAGEPSI